MHIVSQGLCNLTVTKRVVARRMLEEFRAERPRHIHFSPTCGPESTIQNLNQRTLDQVLNLERKRHRVRRIQRHIKMIIHNLALSNPDIHTSVEQPGSCGSWRGEFADLKQDPTRTTCVIDGCGYGMRDEKTGLLMHKRWHVFTHDINLHN